MTKLKALVLDIETAPITAYVWGRQDQNIGLSQVVADWYVLAWSAKWLNEHVDEMIYRDQRHAKDITKDKALLEPLWKLLNEADVVITQNGQNFDTPKLNARFILNGMRPPSPYKQLDTYRLARRVAKFTSNSLEYLSDKLCTKYKKLKHRKYPGMALWTACLKGDMTAWDEMKLYNRHDVLATEELYNKLRAWAPESSPVLYDTQSAQTCKICGVSGRIVKEGIKRTKTAKYQRLQCQNCGTWSHGEKI